MPEAPVLTPGAPVSTPDAAVLMLGATAPTLEAARNLEGLASNRGVAQMPQSAVAQGRPGSLAGSRTRCKIACLETRVHAPEGK